MLQSARLCVCDGPTLPFHMGHKSCDTTDPYVSQKSDQNG